MLDREPCAGAAKARLHLIGDQENAVLVTDRAQLLHHLEGHGGIAAFAKHRLDDDRGNTLGLGIGEEEVF